MDIRPAEQHLIDRVAYLPPGRVLCTTAGRGQLAVALSARGETDVTCWLLDLYQAQQTQRELGRLPANLHLVCESDPPPDDYAAAALCFSYKGDSELTRDVLQAAHERLAIGGTLLAAIDNPRDQWLHEQLRGQFDKVTRQPERGAVIYRATKTVALKKHKNYACELAFRDGERLIHLRTRPGVFSHREVDGGARALVKSMHIEPGMRVLDLGCGSGAVGIAAGLRAEGVHVHATDSNPRAIEAVGWAAERNGLVSRVTAALDCDGTSIQPETFDMVLANPPYFSNFRIAGLFVAIASRALRPGGKLLVVTKSPEWYALNLTQGWLSVEDRIVSQYHVVGATKP